MAPKKKLASTSSAPVPAPNALHPSAAHIAHAIKTKNRAHPPSYHSFIDSPFFLNSQSTAAGNKKRAAGVAPGLVAPGKGALEVAEVHKKLLRWFDGVSESRGMPWRKDVDVKALRGDEKTQRGYEVWVSETMLQQTQVATVIPYFERWMVKFPTVAALAASDIEDINAVWAGLGYYSRASRLLKGAQTVMRDFGGSIPEGKDELEMVDGIGPYTAGAISSIAFGQRSPLVDGNVIRVLSRLTAMHATQMAKPSTNYIWALADILVPAYEADLDVGGPNKCGAWNQALMELGSTVCTPKNPRCGECPLSEECLAYAEVRTLAHPAAKGDAPPVIDLEDLCELCEPTPVSRELGVTLYPMAKERKKPREEETAVCVLEWESSASPQEGDEAGGGRKVLIVKRPEKGLLAGLFEFPAVDLPSADELSTAPVRKRYLEKLINALVDERIPAFAPPSDDKTPDPSSTHLRVKEVHDLSSILQVYSHQKRDYHILRVLLTSPTLPALSPPRTREPREGDLVQSVPGRAKWVDEGVLAESNLGGAMLKVLEVREKGVKSKPAPRKAAAPKKVEKGLVGLGNWLVKKKVEEEVAVDEVKVAKKEKSAEFAVVEVTPSKEYKKRRIVLSSDEE